MSQPLIDKQRLMQEFAGDEEILRDMTEAFQAELPKMMAGVEEAVREGDAKKLEHAAHSLKGAISNFQTAVLKDASFSLEKMGRAGELAGAKDEFEKLKVLIESFNKELAQLSANNPAA